MAATANSYRLPLSFSQIFELVKQLPLPQRKKLIKVLQQESTSVITNDIPQEHKAMVRDRIKKSKPSELLDWESAKNDFDGI
jgi:hypothetical protein